MRFTFSKEIRLGEIFTALAILFGGIGVYSNFNAKMALMEQAQAAQSNAIREMKDDVKEQGRTINRIEEKVNRARL